MVDRKNEMNIDIRYLHGILTFMVYLYDKLQKMELYSMR